MIKFKKNNLLTFLLTVTFITSSFFTSGVAHAVEKEVVDIKISDSKITNALEKAMSDKVDKKIPIYIWYDDTEVNDIKSKVEEQMGFSCDDIENSYPVPKNELLNELSIAANSKPSKYLELMMENHLKMTSDAREEERRKTEIYIDALNAELTSAYNELSENLKKENSITDDEVIFTSSFAPMIIASLSTDEIEKLSDCKGVCQLDLFEEIKIETTAINMGNTFTTMGIDNIASSLSLSGENVKIGIHDDGNVSISQDTSAVNYNLDTSKVTLVGSIDSQGDHATYVASIAAGRNGIAPNASIYSASGSNEFYSYNQAGGLDNLEALVASGVRVINCSWGIRGDYRYNNDGSENYYTSFEKYIDSIISNSKVTIVWATGNEDGELIRCPALAFNCISVNGFMNNIINPYSYQHGYGCYKPDVIACSLNNGTSTAAPVITGMIALLYEYKPNLMTHPELVKAILLASVHNKIEYAEVNGVSTPINENILDGLTSRQGAGVPNLYRMISIVAQHSYGYGEFNSNTGYSRDIPILQPKYGAEYINVSMAYLQTNIEVNNPSTRDDYDISLHNPTLSSEYSNISISSTEMIYNELSDSNNNYTLNIKRYENPYGGMIYMDKVNYGYAWSTDNTKFYPTNYEDGIYYIKNAKSGKYLTYNNDNNDVKLENFNGNMTQLWVINDDYGIFDYLKSTNGSENNLALGTLSGSFYKAVRSTDNFYLSLFNNSDGTYSFERFISTSGYRLGVKNNSLNASVDASWYTKNINNQSQKWYIEASGFKRGDVNLDGEITNVDASLTLGIYSDLATGNGNVNNIQKFLGDYDRDGDVDSSDASLILANTTS